MNLVGSVAFGVSAVASYVKPNGQLVSLALTNLGTFVGAVCFLAGAVLLLPERTLASPSTARARAARGHVHVKAQHDSPTTGPPSTDRRDRRCTGARLRPAARGLPAGARRRPRSVLTSRKPAASSGSRITPTRRCAADQEGQGRR